jgi:hypothetical protein
MVGRNNEGRPAATERPSGATTEPAAPRTHPISGDYLRSASDQVPGRFSSKGSDMDAKSILVLAVLVRAAAEITTILLKS